MHSSTPLPRRQLLWLAVIVLPFSASLHAEEAVTIFSQTYNGYARTRLEDHSYKPETYTFGEGGAFGRNIVDPSLDKLTFNKVAHLVAKPLAKANYRPSLKTDDTDLLILVFWGTTEGSTDHDRSSIGSQALAASSAYSFARAADASNGAKEASPETNAATSDLDSTIALLSLANADRDHLDNRNARILGYTEAVDRARFVPHMSFAQDTLSEVSANRYFVVLQAYDFRTAVKEKKLKPLWTARISVSEHGDFSEELDRMVWSASSYFGQDSRGLKREALREGRVNAGPTKLIEVVPEK